MNIEIEIREDDLKKLVLQEIQYRLGDGVKVELSDIKIETKSKQNYKSEWESAAFKATYSKSI